MDTAFKKRISPPDLKRKNLVEEVFEFLRDRILSGKLKEGEQLPPLEALGQQFNVSRTVIREAVKKLSSLGLIESYQGRGTFVSSSKASIVMEPMIKALFSDQKSIGELLEARYFLEKIIAGLAAKRVRPEHTVLLKETLERMKQGIKDGDHVALTKEDLNFHLILVEISGNSIFKRVLETIREMMFDFMEGISYVPGVPEKALERHMKIFDAVIRNDVNGAVEEMQKHIIEMIDVMRERYHVEPDISINS
jgi:GntR family transcriptional regulator, transcriptional repressor for pyruvate dehydrogenase complex